MLSGNLFFGVGQHEMCPHGWRLSHAEGTTYVWMRTNILIMIECHHSTVKKCVVLRLRRDAIRDNSTSANATSYGGEWTIAGFTDHGTSHLAVVDAQRNAVSFTTTINTGFGCKVMSRSTGACASSAIRTQRGQPCSCRPRPACRLSVHLCRFKRVQTTDESALTAGIILNNQMDDFSTPGQANGCATNPEPLSEATAVPMRHTLPASLPPRPWISHIHAAVCSTPLRQRLF